MKKFIVLSIISVCFLSVVQSQTTIKLSEKLSFFCSFPEVTVDNSFDTTIICGNGVPINKKQVQLNAPINFYQTFGSKENNLYLIYEITSKPKTDKSKAGSLRDIDTLYFVLDQIYADGVDKILLDMDGFNYINEVTWVNDTFAYKVLEPCTLNVLSILRKEPNIELNIIFKENYEFNGPDTIYLAGSDAIHQLIWDPKDENGNPLLTQGPILQNKFIIFFEFDNGGYGIVNYSQSPSYTYKISDYHGAVPMIFGTQLYNFESGSSNYLIEYPFQDSILEDITFSNDPDQLAHIVADFSYFVKRDSNMVGIADFTKWVCYTGNFGYLGWISHEYQDPNPSWQTSLYMDMKEIEIAGYSTRYNLDYYESNDWVDHITSPFYDEFDDSITGCVFLTPEQDLHLINYGDVLFYGKGFSYYWSDWNNSSSAIYCETDNMGMWGEYFDEDIAVDTYKVTDSNGNIIKEGAGLEILSYGLEPGTYVVEQNNSSCHFKDYIGSSKLTSTINTTMEDRTPPHVIRVYLLNDNNTIKHQYITDERVIIKFTASDFTSYNNWYVGSGFQPLAYSNTKVSLKLHDEDEWSEANYSEIIDDTIIGTQYFADLTDYITIDSALYDIKIYVEDLSGNSTEHVFSPAFIYGNFIVNIPDNSNNENISADIIIHPNPTHNSITISNKVGNLSQVNNFKILSMDGNVLKIGKINQESTSTKINVYDLSPGIYIISIFDEDIPKVTKKIIKLH